MNIVELTESDKFSLFGERIEDEPAINFSSDRSWT